MSTDYIEFVDYIFDRYAFLSLEPTSSREEIEARIKRLKSENHPDRLTNVGDDLKTQAKLNWEAIEKCEEVLLKDDLRPGYDQRLASFKAEKPHLITRDANTKIVDLDREFINLDFLTSDQEPDTSFAHEIAAIISGFNVKEFARTKKLYEKDPEDPDLIDAYREALEKKVEYLSEFEKDLWKAMGVSGKAFTESKATLMDTGLIGATVGAQIEHVKDTIIPTFVEQRSGMLALGYDKNPLMLLTHDSASITNQPISSDAASQIETAQARFAELSEALKVNAEERAQTIAALLELSPFEMLHAATPEAVIVHLLKDQTGGNNLEAGRVVRSILFVGRDIQALNNFSGKSIEELRSAPLTETAVAIVYNRNLNDPYLSLGHAYKKALKHLGVNAGLTVNTKSEEGHVEETPRHPMDAPVQSLPIDEPRF